MNDDNKTARLLDPDAKPAQEQPPAANQRCFDYVAAYCAAHGLWIR